VNGGTTKCIFCCVVVDSWIMEEDLKAVEVPVSKLPSVLSPSYVDSHWRSLFYRGCIRCGASFSGYPWSVVPCSRSLRVGANWVLDSPAQTCRGETRTLNGQERQGGLDVRMETLGFCWGYQDYGSA
jgi:hypothetical protein